MGKGDKKDRQFAQMIEAALQHDKVVRIGVNWGSLDQAIMAQLMDENALRAQPWESRQVMYEALITSALQSAAFACELGMKTRAGHPVLQGQWRAGPDQRLPSPGATLRLPFAPGADRSRHGHQRHPWASTAALAILLQEGIGDTIRVSLTPQPGEARTQEVVVASEILQSLGMRMFVPSVTACPGCGRTTSTTFQELAKQIDDFLRAQMPVWRAQYPGVEGLKVAVMGCIVNGPGESKHADIGISLPGNGEAPAAPVFIDGEKALTLRGEGIAREFPDPGRGLHRQTLRRRSRPDTFQVGQGASPCLGFCLSFFD